MSPVLGTLPVEQGLLTGDLLASDEAERSRRGQAGQKAGRVLGEDKGTQLIASGGYGKASQILKEKGEGRSKLHK